MILLILKKEEVTHLKRKNKEKSKKINEMNKKMDKLKISMEKSQMNMDPPMQKQMIDDYKYYKQNTLNYNNNK